MGIDLNFFRRPPRELVVELSRLKIVRYSFASAVAVVVSQVALLTFNAGMGWSGVRANLASVAIASIPNYTINRYWTWHQDGRNRLWTEIVPFWVMALLGTILSTLAVNYADERWGTPLAVGVAQLSGFGVLWIARFLILDRLIWTVVHDLHPEIDEDETAAGTAAVPPNGSGAQAAPGTHRANGVRGNGAESTDVLPATPTERSGQQGT